MRLLFGLLAAAANIAVVVALLLLIPKAAGLRSQVLVAIEDREMHLSWVVAAVATFGSLYLSEIVHLEPCRMCWYQRIAMYPLVVILAVAAWRRDRRSGSYVVPIAGIGIVISIYHFAMQHFPSLEGGACGSGVACSTPYFRQFGFMSIPYMAGSAFALILVLALGASLNNRSSSDASHPVESLAHKEST